MLSEAALMYQNTVVNTEIQLSRLFTTAHGCTVPSVHFEIVMNYDLEG